jgi:hypothetical protein
MYSTLTLLPVLVTVVPRHWRAPAAVVGTVAGILTVSAPPLGDWAVTIFPLVVGLGLVALWLSPGDGDGFWPPRWARGDDGHAPIGTSPA